MRSTFEKGAPISKLTVESACRTRSDRALSLSGKYNEIRLVKATLVKGPNGPTAVLSPPTFAECRDAGADDVVDTSQGNVEEAFRDLTNGRVSMLRPQVMGSRYAAIQAVIGSLDLAARDQIWPLVTELVPLENAEALHQRVEKGLVTDRAALSIDWDALAAKSLTSELSVLDCLIGGGVQRQAPRRRVSHNGGTHAPINL